MIKSSMRQEVLNKDLIEYNPKSWKINLPIRDYTFRVEDFIPALSGVIGKSSLVAAFAVAWAAGYNITDTTFVIENVRLELVVGGIFTILFCAILNPYAGPPGTLAPLIPMVPIMAASGVHPLPLGILIGSVGLAISVLKCFDKVVKINGEGTKGGIIILFGFLGFSSCLDSLKSWADQSKSSEVFGSLLIVGLLLYITLNKLQAKWLTIPACAIGALAISFLYGLCPVLQTGMGLPIISPDIWWNDKWGIGWGLNLDNFASALPFALLAVVMWPIDALAIRTLQETNYPKEAQKAVFNMNSTYIVVSLRNIIGAFLGGGQTSAIWRSYMIPLGIVKRPIGASALLLGILAVGFGILGFPIDIAIFPPLLWLVLIFGVFVPLFEVGLNIIRSTAAAQVAAICVIAGIAVNPVLGWIAAICIENFNIINNPNYAGRNLTAKEKYITAALIIIAATTFLFTY